MRPTPNPRTRGLVQRMAPTTTGAPIAKNANAPLATCASAPVRNAAADDAEDDPADALREECPAGEPAWVGRGPAVVQHATRLNGGFEIAGGDRRHGCMFLAGNHKDRDQRRRRDDDQADDRLGADARAASDRGKEHHDAERDHQDHHDQARVARAVIRANLRL